MNPYGPLSLYRPIRFLAQGYQSGCSSPLSAPLSPPPPSPTYAPHTHSAVHNIYPTHLRPVRQVITVRLALPPIGAVNLYAHLLLTYVPAGKLMPAQKILGPEGFFRDCFQYKTDQLALFRFRPLNPPPPSDAVRKRKKILQRIFKVQYFYNSKNITPLETLSFII